MKKEWLKIKASRLKSGDNIGVCSPSGIVEKKHNLDFKKSEKLLASYNIKTIYSKKLYAKSLKYSASPKEKSEDLNDLISNVEIKAIIFAKGGSNCNGILPFIDYDCIKKNPKAFVGFSDNTILLNAIYKKTGLITYHFTNYKGFCEKNIIFNKKQFEKNFIIGNKGIVDKNEEWVSIRKGVATGKLIGGNLASLVKILNTEYCPSFDNKILFIEDLSFESCAEDISSYLYQLKNSKVFEKINGLLIGAYDPKEGYTLEEIVMDVVKEYNFPVLKCNDFGHTATNIVLPIGIKCTLDANKKYLVYEEQTMK